MKTTICDTPSSRASGIVNEIITSEQRAELTRVGDAFWLIASQFFSEEIEAVKIEAAYINHADKMTSIKFRLAFNPFLRYSDHQSAKIINVSGLWDIDRKIFWYTHEDLISTRNFPTSSSNRFNLASDSHELIANCLLEALARVIERSSFSLHNEASHLSDHVCRIRRTSTITVV